MAQDNELFQAYELLAKSMQFASKNCSIFSDKSLANVILDYHSDEKEAEIMRELSEAQGYIGKAWAIINKLWFNDLTDSLAKDIISSVQGT